MPQVVGSKVNVEFTAFPGQYPTLYYSAGEGTYSLASVNAGNSDGLCVGLLGVNGQFFTDLTAAGQKKAGTNPQGDDYQARHQSLLLKALADPSHSASETYTVTDPNVFSYCYAAPVIQSKVWHDGVCFVDVFDAALRPAGNAKNAFMLYVAPPYDVNYSSQAAFLLAIETTAHNVIATVAGYNALAAARKLPVVEAVRLTLFSSNFYNTRWSVDTGDIAHAIWRGLLAGIQAFPASGLLELQLPAGSGSQSALFGVLRADPALAPAPSAPVVPTPLHPAPFQPFPGVGRGLAQVEVESTFEHEADEFKTFTEEQTVEPTEDDKTVLKNSDSTTQTVIASIRQAGDAWTKKITAVGGGVPLQDVAGKPPGQRSDYGDIPRSRPLEALALGNVPSEKLKPGLTAATDFYNAIRDIPGAKAQDVRGALQRALTATKAMDAALKAIERAPPSTEYADATLLARPIVRALHREMQAAGKPFLEYARMAYTARRASEAAVRSRNVSIGIAIGGVSAVAILVGSLVGTLGKGSKSVAAGDFTLPFGPRRAKDTEARQLVFAVITLNNLVGMVTTVAVPAGSAGWVVGKDNVVTFTAADDLAADATVTYTLTMTDGTTRSGKLTASFAPDLVAAAADRTTAVSFDAREGFDFVDDPVAPSPWIESKQAAPNASLPKVTFTPPTGFTDPYVLRAFTDKAGGAEIPRNLVILFPAQTLPVTPVTQANRTTVALDAIPAFQAGDEVSIVLVSGNSQTESTKLAVTGGVWEANQGKITFTPDDQLPPGATTLTVDYALKYGKTLSAKGTATVSYPAVATVTALDLTANAFSRTKAVKIAVKGVTGVTAPAAGAPGAWTFDAGGITFTPNNTLAATGAVTVAAAYNVGSSQARVSVSFVQPAPRTANNVSRVVGTIFLPAADTEPNLRVWLWDKSTNSRVESLRTKHQWSIARDQKTILFTPSTTKFEEAGETVSFVFSDGTDNSPLTDATVNFSQATEAFPLVDVKGPIPTTITRNVTDYCYVQAPKTITGISLIGIDATRAKVNASSPTIITFDPGSTARIDRGRYSVMDSAGATSNQASLVFEFTAPMSRRAMPMAANCLIAQSAAPDQMRIADVLKGASAYHGLDPTSVKLTGPVDLGGSVVPVTVGLAATGKSMYVPFQGVWLVDPGGAIVFHADKTFSQAPTPVGFTVGDKKGNVSEPAFVVFDAGLATAQGVPAKIATTPESTFWTDFRIHVSLVRPALDAAAFLVATHSLAYATGLKAKPGNNPVDLEDFDTAFQAWLDGGQAWDDAPGSKTQIGLVTICQRLVAKAMPAGSPEILTRYWRLQHMAHMVAQALPDGGAQ